MSVKCDINTGAFLLKKKWFNVPCSVPLFLDGVLNWVRDYGAIRRSWIYMVGQVKPLLTCIALMVLFTSCIQLRQEARVSGPVHPHLTLCDDRYVLVGLDMNREKIVVEQSHIMDPSGKRHAIEVEPHQFDIDRKSKLLRVEVYPCCDDGSRIRRWSNGIWAFHFVVDTNGAAQVIDQQWKYWTFYYNPIIHGPPN